ncbi:hypothetical protein CVT24_012198 [Panaeolus cyanescens]|uniref:Protein-S-isoprenylcysteine O-methyltransferase n=1 Tax=Panaeolus cyanescens TaxID=181874 RepID=A0A409YIU2_9AGAR|nr:hypothetical protein CVT24_012198 [Panaeolus cyanescens]
MQLVVDYPILNALVLVASVALYAAAYQQPTPPLKRQERRNITGVMEGHDFILNSFVAALAIPPLLITLIEVYLILSRYSLHSEISFGSRSAHSTVWNYHGAPSVYLTPLRILGLAMMGVGAVIRLVCFRTLGKFFTFFVGVQKDHQLITSFPYSVVRHPSYGALLLTQPGAVLAHGLPGSWLYESGLLFSRPWAVIYWAYGFLLVYHATWIMHVRVLQEDKMLKEHFGKEWEEWAKDVKYRLIPGVY